MARFGVKRNSKDNKPEQIFEASKTTFNQLGFEIYKMRPFAFLVQGRTTGDEGLININIIASPFAQEYSLTLKSETASQETVDALGEKILALLEENINQT